MTQELKPGEFFLTADGGIQSSGKLTGMHFNHTRESLKRVGGTDEYARILRAMGYTQIIRFDSGRTYSTEGSAIKEVAPAEVKRAPLTNSDAWRYTDKRVDRWAGFVVDKMDINMPCDPWNNNRHSLQRMTEGTNPTHGSALLLKD